MNTTIEKRGNLIDTFAEVNGKRKYIGTVHELSNGKYSDGFEIVDTMHGAIHLLVERFKSKAK